MNIEVDLHDFSDDEIEEYARDHLDMIKEGEADIEDFFIDDLVEEINKRGYKVLDFNEPLNIIQESLLDRFLDGFNDLNLKQLEQFLNQNNL